MFGSFRKHPRLGQWNGRRRSSRSDEPMLPQLWQRPVLVRLAVVWVTAALVAAFAYAWGPPFPYRVGETYPFDLRVRVDFQVVDAVELVNREEAQRSRDAKAPATEKPVIDRF